MLPPRPPRNARTADIGRDARRLSPPPAPRGPRRVRPPPPPPLEVDEEHAALGLVLGGLRHPGHKALDASPRAPPRAPQGLASQSTAAPQGKPASAGKRVILAMAMVLRAPRRDPRPHGLVAAQLRVIRALQGSGKP